MCCTQVALAASIEGLTNVHVERLKEDENVVEFYAKYKAGAIYDSYHTTGWYVTREKTDDARTVDNYYIDVRPNKSSTHTYEYGDDGFSHDLNRFSFKDVKAMLETLFDENEDLTQPHTIYLHDVYIQKHRDDPTTQNWVYDWNCRKGGPYSTLDEFLTMYPAYKNNAAKREEMSHYYNIPFTIALTGAEVTINFIDESGAVIKESETIKVYVGDDLIYEVPETITNGGTTFNYKEFQSDFADTTVENFELKITEIKQSGSVNLIYAGDGGGDGTPEPEEGDSMSATATGPVASIIVNSDIRDNEEFDVSAGIPTTSSMYANGFTSKYLMDYSFQNVVGQYQYVITVSRDYRLVNYKTVYEEDEDGVLVPTIVRQESYRTVSRNYTVTRPYSYWKVERLNVYVPSKMLVENTALPGGAVTLPAVALQNPRIVLSVPSSNVIEPSHRNVTLTTKTLYDTSYVPYEDWHEYAESAVGKVRVVNDYLKIDDVVYMSSTIAYNETARPTAPEVVGPIVDNHVFFKTNMLIPYDVKNAVYKTKAKVTYTQFYNYGAVGKNLAKDYKINSTNSVTVHTPVVCKPKLTSLSEQYVQSVSAGTGTNLVLDGYFTVDLPTTGQHLNIKGYGNRDYAAYTFGRQVCFPFGVYDGNTYVEPNTWYEISSKTTFYLPTWVKEGDYVVKFRAFALNADLNNLDALGQSSANKQRSKYVATASKKVTVSGRVYGFQVYDITDYPTWETVFRKPNSLKLSGTTYRVGFNNRNGVLSYPDSVFTLPIMSGSHPNIKNKTVGTGYMFRYYLYTIGSTHGDRASISIKPTFYYVSKDGSSRQEVDVYYSESINGKYTQLVKVGNSVDQQNIKSISLGNDYMAISESELANTAKALGTTVTKLKSAKINAYTFSQINLLSGLRTFVGSQANVPTSVGATAALKSVQKWYGDFYLPSEVHVTKKGFNLEAYSSENSMDFSEDFWLGEDGGYLVVNFDISVYNDGSKVLAYKSDNCNMWQLEGYQNTKTDYYQKTFALKDGDIIFYDLSQSARKDYRPGGTH